MLCVWACTDYDPSNVASYGTKMLKAGDSCKFRTVAIFVTVDSHTVLLYTICNYVYDKPSYRTVAIRFIVVLLWTLSRKLGTDYNESPLCSIIICKN
jgi:hypothetical protein